MAASTGDDPSAPAPVAAADAPFPPLRAVLGFALMCVGMFMAILDIQIVAASLGEIQAGLAASADEISWVQTSYLVAEVVMIPLSGFLMRAWGMRNLFALSAGGFVIASIACASATTIEQMIAFRALQGFLGGAMIPVTYAISFVLFPRRYQTQVTVAVALLVTLAPTIGPSLGGWLTDSLSWRWIFLINIAPGLLCTLGVLALVPAGRMAPGLLRRIDLLGLLFMALFLAGLDFVLEEGSRHDWFEDSAILRVAIVSAVASVLFLWRATTAAEPIVDLRPLTNRNFAAGCTLQLVMGFGLFGLTYLYPLFLGRVGGLSAGQIGATVWVTGLTMLVSAPIFGRLARLTDPRLICSAGFLLLAASCWASLGLTAEWRFDQFVLPQVLRGMGLMCCIVSTTVIAFATLSDEQASVGSPLITLMRNLGGALGLGIINTVFAARFDLHWSRLSEWATLAREETAALLERLGRLAETRGLDPDTAPVAMLARMTAREAAIMSYSDVFAVLMWLFLAMAILPWLLRRPPTFLTARPAD
jgi:DHA2 family multidrug resistance protein